MKVAILLTTYRSGAAHASPFATLEAADLEREYLEARYGIGLDSVITRAETYEQEVR